MYIIYAWISRRPLHPGGCKQDCIVLEYTWPPVRPALRSSSVPVSALSVPTFHHGGDIVVLLPKLPHSFPSHEIEPLSKDAVCSSCSQVALFNVCCSPGSEEEEA